jgi:hypothetical protein
MPYKNKADQKRSSDRHYELNKNRCKQRALDCNKKRRARNKKFIQDYLATHPCIDCGETDPIVLEFDHVRGTKVSNVTDMSRRVHGINAIIKEISKCEVRCANCHRRITHKRREEAKKEKSKKREAPIINIQITIPWQQ